MTPTLKAPRSVWLVDLGNGELLRLQHLKAVRQMLSTRGAGALGDHGLHRTGRGRYYFVELDRIGKHIYPRVVTVSRVTVGQANRVLVNERLPLDSPEDPAAPGDPDGL